MKIQWWLEIQVSEVKLHFGHPSTLLEKSTNIDNKYWHRNYLSRISIISFKRLAAQTLVAKQGLTLKEIQVVNTHRKASSEHSSRMTSQIKAGFTCALFLPITSLPCKVLEHGGKYLRKMSLGKEDRDKTGNCMFLHSKAPPLQRSKPCFKFVFVFFFKQGNRTVWNKKTHRFGCCN